MKKCKSCMKEIDEKAKKCPHCQTDLRNWFLRHPILTGILILIVISILGSSGKGSNKSSSNTNISVVNEVKPTETIYKIGDTVRTDRFEFVISSVEERSIIGSRYFEKEPSEGGTFVAVQYQYKNTSDKPIGTFSTPTIKLVDKNGTQYSADTGASSNFATELKLDRKILSDLNPGITVKDASIFEVSKEQYATAGWSLFVDADKDIKVFVK